MVLLAKSYRVALMRVLKWSLIFVALAITSPAAATPLEEATKLYMTGDLKAAYKFAVARLDEGDYDTAYRLLNRLAGTDNVPEAQEKMGLIFERGLGVPKNYERAFDWYNMSAFQGYVEAQFALATLYFEEIGRAHV